MNATRHLQTYRSTEMATVDSGTLLLMLYQGAIDFLRQAKASLDSGDMAEKGKNINRALAIVAEFLTSLNFEVGGEVARNLENLYLFMIDHITTANVVNDAKPLEDTIGLLCTLKEGWEGAIAAERKRAAQGKQEPRSIRHGAMLQESHERSLTARA
jgi:flagellar secretion chaperone FliS